VLDPEQVPEELGPEKPLGQEQEAVFVTLLTQMEPDRV
jgi:hypothetical protein